MAYPSIERIELPILQELVATGGVDDVRFLYDRLVAYFPQLSDREVRALGDGHQAAWRRVVQRAGASLCDKRQIERRRGKWTITNPGRQRAADEEQFFSFAEAPPVDAGDASAFSHGEAQQMLLDVGRVLGRHTQAEFEYYDVVWRSCEDSPRLSHVFEVQHKGNVDAALAKLKRAYDAQRSKTFLVVATEQDTNRARKQLDSARTGPFHEIGRATTILSFAQLRKLHRALISVEDVLAEISE